MQHTFPVTDAGDACATSRERGSAGNGQLMRLQAAIASDVRLDGVALDVALARECGAVEVTVSGRTGGLTLLFDRTEPPSLIRHVVREAVSRYRSSLDVPPARSHFFPRAEGHPAGDSESINRRRS